MARSSITVGTSEVLTDLFNTKHRQIVGVSYGDYDEGENLVSKADPLPVYSPRWVNSSPIVADPSLLEVRRFTRDGDGVTFDANLDLLSAPARWMLTPEPETHWLVKSVTMFFAGDPNTEFGSPLWFGKTLSNKIGLTVRDVAAPTIVVHELLGGFKIGAPRDWALVGDVEIFDVGPEATVGKLKIEFPGFLNTRLDSVGPVGTAVSFDLQDDFSELAALNFSAEVIELDFATYNAQIVPVS